MLRYANLTCDAVEGLAEQLGPTSLLNNTPPDETVTRALEGLKTLSQLMYELLGADDAQTASSAGGGDDLFLWAMERLHYVH